MEEQIHVHPTAARASISHEIPYEHEHAYSHGAPEYLDEKKQPNQDIGVIAHVSDDVPEDLKAEIEATHMDPYTPFPLDPLQPVETRILTVRAVVVGCMLGALVNASNLYLGLKTGWTFSANMFGAIFGFAILRAFSLSGLPLIGGHFGPMENNIIQTSATAAGGLGIIFVSAIPAIYKFGLLSKDPQHDFGKLIAFTAVAAYFGMCFSVPLRKFFIIHLAKELSLVYPTATATAFTIQSMHVVGKGAAEAKLKIKALTISFAGAFGLRVASQYAIGLLWDWHIFYWLYALDNFKNHAINAETWGWYIEFTPAFIGSGMLVGLNAALSFFGGSVIAWGIIGPILVQTGHAFGKPRGNMVYNVPEYYNYASLGPAFVTKDHPSARYWLLWPGVLLMMVTSFVELGVNYRVIGRAFASAGRAMFVGIHNMQKNPSQTGFIARQAQKEVRNDVVEDPSPPEDQVPFWMWGSGAITCIIFTIVVLTLQFRFSVGLCILSLLLAFLFAFLAIQCTGATDTTPITTVSKASQLIVGGVTKGQGLDMNHSKLLNLMAGAVSAGAASQASDLVNDFKVGFLLRTPPRIQWYAQAIGSVVAVFLAPSLFILFVKAYPCIIDANADECAFDAPSVAAWQAVATAMTDPSFPIPNSSGIFAIALSILGGLVVLAKHHLNHAGKGNIAAKLPNMMIVGLGFLLPQTVYGKLSSLIIKFTLN